MAKPAARLGDNVAHIGASGAILNGSGNVLVNSLPAARQTDPVQHDEEVEVITQGSSTVLFNSLPASRITDAVACGGKIGAGSGNVLIGDGGAVACSTCPGGVTVGNPVNPLLGAKVLSGDSELDFALPGPLSVVWQRTYSSYIGPAGAQAGILGQGWRLPLEMRLRLSDEKTELFDTKNRVITFGPLAPGEQEHSTAEGFWLLRGGRSPERSTPPPALPAGVNLEDLHPASRALYAYEPWQDLQRWSHIPAQWRESPACCLAATNDGNVWLFACLDDLPTPSSQWLLLAIIDIYGRIQRFERALSNEARNLPKGMIQPKRPRPNEPELPLGQLIAITDALGRRFALHYIQLSLAAKDASPGDTGLRLVSVHVHDAGNPELQRALNGSALVRYHYSPQGDLVEVKDRHGRATRTFTYEITQDKQHRMTSHRVLGGPASSYIYEERPVPGKSYGRVVRQRNEGGLDYRFDYQAEQTVVTDSLGRTTVYAFKGEGGKQRLVQLTDAMGGVTQYEHNLYGQLVQETDPLGRLTQYRRDARGRLTAMVLPDGSQTQTQWHETLSALSSIQNPDGLTTTFTYDKYGRLLQSRVQDGSPDGNVTQHSYPEPTSSLRAMQTAELPLQTTDPKGGVKTFTWSNCGQLLRYTDCSNQSTEYIYDIWGNLNQVTNALGQTTSYHVNAQGQLVTVTYPDQTQSHYHYDERGQLAHAVDAAGKTSAYERDAQGRAVVSTQGGRSIRFRYDAAARLTAFVNENGTSTSFTYDALNRLIEEVGFDGRRQCYQYDAAGQLTACTDQGLDRNTGKLSDPLITRYAYDKAGRLVRREVPPVFQGRETLFPHQTQHFTYDKAGHLTEAQCDKTSLLFTRDSRGRIVKELLSHEDVNPYTAPYANSSVAGSADQFTHWISHEYDALGLREASLLPHVGRIDYLHYGSGHVHQVAHNRTPLVDFERDPLHRETLRRINVLACEVAGLGACEDSGISLHRSFDAMGRLMSLSSHSVAEVMGQARAHPINTVEPLVGGQSPTPAPTISALSRNYRYDLLGQLIAAEQGTQRFAGLKAPEMKSTQFQYDLAHRLVAARYADGQTQKWQFDPAGNRLPVPDSTAHTPVQSSGDDGSKGESWLTRSVGGMPPAAHQQYWADNRVHQATHEIDGRIENQSIEYDAWGNIRHIVTTNGPRRGRTLDLLYDGLHQLRASLLFEPNLETEETGARQMAPLQGEPPQTGKTYATFYDYDPLGRRISKAVVSQRAGKARRIDARTWFGWDGDRLVSTETDTAVARKVINTVYEPQSFVPLLRFEIDLRSELKSETEVLHYHCNQIGMPEALIDRRGEIVWQADFDPWGNLRSEYNPNNVKQEIRMRGQQEDPESGLFYNRHRYYIPSIGRYVTADPMGLLGGANRYLYPTNPIQFSDPLGLFQVYGYKLPASGEVVFTFDFKNPSMMELERVLGRLPGVGKGGKWAKKGQDKSEQIRSAGHHDTTDPVAACACDKALKQVFENNNYKAGGQMTGTQLTRAQAEKILSDFQLVLTELQPPYDAGNIEGGAKCKALYKWSEMLNLATERAVDVKGTFGSIFN